MLFNSYLRDFVVSNTRLSTAAAAQSQNPVTSTTSNDDSHSRQFVLILKALSDVKQSRKRCKVNKC